MELLAELKEHMKFMVFIKQEICDRSKTPMKILEFHTGGSERVRITSGGTAIFKAGLAEKFNNTGTTILLQIIQ